MTCATTSCYILYQLVKDDPARHYWLVVLSTAELYGGCIRIYLESVVLADLLALTLDGW